MKHCLYGPKSYLKLVKYSQQQTPLAQRLSLFSNHSSPCTWHCWHSSSSKEKLAITKSSFLSMSFVFPPPEAPELCCDSLGCLPAWLPAELCGLARMVPESCSVCCRCPHQPHWCLPPTFTRAHNVLLFEDFFWKKKKQTKTTNKQQNKANKYIV